MTKPELTNDRYSYNILFCERNMPILSDKYNDMFQLNRFQVKE